MTCYIEMVNKAYYRNTHTLLKIHWLHNDRLALSLWHTNLLTY